MSGSRALTKEEHTKTKNAFTTLRNKCLYILLKNTGFRISEILPITIQSVKNSDYLRVSRQNMKGQVESREVVLNSEAKNAIAEYLASFDSSNVNAPLFKSREGENKPISRFMAQKIFKAAFEEAEIQGSVSTHSCRKSFALNIYEKSKHDLLLVQRALGHSSIMTTVRYLPTNQERLEAIIKDEDYGRTEIS